MKALLVGACLSAIVTALTVGAAVVQDGESLDQNEAAIWNQPFTPHS